MFDTEIDAGKARRRAFSTLDRIGLFTVPVAAAVITDAMRTFMDRQGMSLWAYAALSLAVWIAAAWLFEKLLTSITRNNAIGFLVFALAQRNPKEVSRLHEAAKTIEDHSGQGARR